MPKTPPTSAAVTNEALRLDPAAVSALMDELEDSLTDAGIVQWLLARNRILEFQRPVDLVRQGRLDEVLRAAKAFTEGVYL